LQTPSADVPTAIFTGELIPAIPNAETLVGLLYISDLITAGGGFKYIQRANPNGLSGNMVFRNITMEDAGDALEISQTCECDWRLESITFDHVGTSDGNCFTCAVINMNAPGLRLAGVLIHNSFAGRGNGTAITINSGLLEDHYVDFSPSLGSNAVVDGQGNPVWNYSGKVTLSGGTATLDFLPISFYANIPDCIANDETTPGSASITLSSVGMTITGGPFDVVDYACFFQKILP
jgi:hypothetical protein